MSTAQHFGAEALPKAYRPAEHEDAIRARWMASGAFHADPRAVLERGKRPFAVLIPPPNVTAALHLGHALNNTLQDILVRRARMRGFETLWMPGTDHAGIATQAVVEKRLQSEGRRRTDFTREQFVALVQEFKDEYEARITDQLKRMGCSCDFQRQRFTMDGVCARAVREAFFLLFRDGLIYRGKRLVNWDPVAQTALADDEVEMREVAGHFWYLRYPLVRPPTNPSDAKDAGEVTWNELATRGYPGAETMPGEENAWVTVATTRPETYLGDTAVAVNPHDPRAKPLRGLMVQLPIVGRIVPIVEDDYVVMPAVDGEASADPKAQYATGFLKVTPAHDTNDYDLYRRHQEVIDAAAGGEGAGIINVMAPDASISDAHGWDRQGRDEGGHVFVGRSREEARDLVVREFKARGLLERVREYTHGVGHSYRSHVPIEPYMSDQWYVRVTDDRLVGRAERALGGSDSAGQRRSDEGSEDGDGALSFHPERYSKVYSSWHANLRDWCISRQLWWGHRIPVWWKQGSGQNEYEREAVFLRLADDFEEGFAWRHKEPSAEDPSYVIAVCVRGTDDSLVGMLEREGFAQDADVLDTWFSSALWPLSTMGWPDVDLSAAETGIEDFAGLIPAFLPTSVLCTAREIITLWVSRMVMFTRLLRGEGERAGPVPFHDVYIHPVIQDGHGQKMSKSLGNGVDPLDVIHTHGADALRLVMAQLATATQDVRLGVDVQCPHCDHAFEPATIKSPTGHVVAGPTQRCPACGASMVTSYGVMTGKRGTGESPVARNTSTRFDVGRNFCNKLWNAARFAISILSDSSIGTIEASGSVARAGLPLADRWMLSRLSTHVAAIDDALEGYEFSAYAQSLYDVLWREFCDWYLEAIKPTVLENAAQAACLRASLDAILRLLHPALPFVTEAIFERLRGAGGPSIEGLTLAEPAHDGLLCSAGWPIARGLRDDEAEREFGRVQSLVTVIRELRAQHRVQPRRKIALHLPDALRAGFAASGGLALIRDLSGVDRAEASSPAGSSVEFVFEGSVCFVSDLADALDDEAERERLEKVIAEARRSLDALDKRLGNPGYADKAPAHLVQQTRDQRARVARELEEARGALERLG